MSSTDGYEQHPFLHQQVRDIVSRTEGELMAVTRQHYDDGRIIRIAHIRRTNGVEITTAVGNIERGSAPHRPHRSPPPPRPRTTNRGGRDVRPL
ncbi:hypothetical protein [Streptomyces sp. Mg1]|uniref:hypothetical protein n=1 Tax=Streptomyces sp. Mg1 TaxID=465541 RepID=UPI000B2FC94E|nr:hypothetical protein [Streptomyces sp. Mg1]